MERPTRTHLKLYRTRIILRVSKEKKPRNIRENDRSTTLYSTVLILGLSLNFGQFDKLIASKLRSLSR